MSWKRSAPAILVSLLVFSRGIPLLAASHGGSAVPPVAQDGMKRLPLPPGLDAAKGLWIWNASDRPAAVSFGSGAALRVEAGAFREVEGARSGGASFRQGSQIVLVAAPRELDPSALELDVQGTVQQEEAGQRVVRLTRPTWAQDLIANAIGRPPLAPGQTLHAAATAADGRIRFAFGLLDAGSAVEVALKDARGAELRSLSVVAAMPVRLRADLGPAADFGDAGVEMKVVRGRAVSAAADFGGLRLKTTNGTASMSSNLIFSGSYTFSVSGGPANTCGELDIYRNGNWEFTPGWFCTNGAGNGTMGPWNWSDKASDETGEPVFIRWPDTSATSTTFVIIDKNYANTYIDSSTPTSSTPTSYYGHATDATWGTGFDFGYAHFSIFQDLDTGKYWDPNTLSYNSNNAVFVTPSFLSQSGRWYVSWGGSTFPSVGSHTTGHHYRWYTCMSDAQNGYCTGNYDFTAN